MIDPIPVHTKWYETTIVEADIPRIYHVPSGDWKNISNSSYHVRETIKNVNTPDPHAIKIKAIRGTLPNNPRINGFVLVGKDLESTFTIIEGNHRFAAAVSKIIPGGNVVISQKSYLGLNPCMNTYKWNFETWNPTI